MALANVELSNTFNEFRTAHNQAATTINNIQDGTEGINVSIANVATANITSVDSNLVPAANLTYDLGSSSLWWNDLYLSGSTIFLGNAQIKAESDTVKLLVNGEEVFTADADGSIPAANAITANTVTINNLTSGRVALVGTSGLITDDSGLTYDSSTDSLTVAGNLDVTGIATLSSNVSILGNLTVTGNTTQLNINELLIDDPVIHLAANNETSDLIDIGFLGHYSDDGGSTRRHAGIFRRAADERFYLFKNYVDADLDNGGNFTVFDIGNATFQLADYIAANAEVNIVTANGLTSTTVSIDTLILDDADGSNSVRLQAPTTVASNVTFKLPDSDGSSGHVIQTDGSGNLSFVAGGATTGKAIAMAIVFG